MAVFRMLLLVSIIQKFKFVQLLLMRMIHQRFILFIWEVELDPIQ